MLQSILNLTPSDQQRLQKAVGPLKSVSEFCTELVEGVKDLPLKSVLEKALPWALKGGEFVAEVAPFGKFVSKVISELAKEWLATTENTGKSSRVRKVFGL